MDFNDRAGPAQPTTTARELANELGAFGASLRDASGKLQEEIRGLDKAKSELQEELSDTVLTFVKNSLPELNGEKFDALAAVAQSVPELGAQGLAFTRKKLLDAREEALKEVNRHGAETVDAAGFEAALEAAKAKADTAAAAARSAYAPVQIADTALRALQTKPEYRFVALNESIAAQGGTPVSSDSREYYSPGNLITAAARAASRGDTYRQVRAALIAADYEKDGTDIFADVTACEKKKNELAQARTEAQKAYAAVQQDQAAAASQHQALADLSGTIHTDEQILGQVQARVAGFFKTPEFVKAVSAQYGEDFPTAIPVMMAKIATLDKLSEGAGRKYAELAETIAKVAGQAAKLNRISPRTQVKADLDAMQKQNAAYRTHFDNYTAATGQSWRRTRQYAAPSVVYVDRSPDFFELMLLNEMMNANRGPNTTVINNNVFVPEQTAPYTADLLGVTRADAETHGLPDAAFDFSSVPGLPDSAFDFTPGQADRPSGPVFDFSTVDDAVSSIPRESEPSYHRSAPSPTFDFETPASGSRSEPTYSSPSFGGRS